MNTWYGYAIGAAILYGLHQVFTKIAAKGISDGLGGFVVEGSAALTILAYLAFLKFGGQWNVVFSPSNQGPRRSFELAAWLKISRGLGDFHLCACSGNVGSNIRSSRWNAGLSQEKLAEKADLHPVYISQVERGEKAVSVEALWKLSKSMRVPMTSFFRGI